MAEPRSGRGFTLIELLVALFITAIVFVMGYGAINQALKYREMVQARQQRLTAVQNAVRSLVQDFTQLTPRPVRDQLGESSLPCLIGSPEGISLTAPADSAASGGSLSLGGAGPANSLGSTGLGGGSTSLGSGSTSLGSSSTSLGSSSTGLGSGAAAGSSSRSDGAGSGSSGGGSQDSSGSSASGLDLVALTRVGWANPAGIQRPAEERVSYRLENGVLERLHWPELDATEGTLPITRNLLDHVKSVTFRYMTDTHVWTDQWPPITTVTLSPLAGNQTLRLRPIAVEVTLELDDWGKIVRIIEVPT